MHTGVIFELADQSPKCARQVELPANNPIASIPPTAKATTTDTPWATTMPIRNPLDTV